MKTYSYNFSLAVTLFTLFLFTGTVSAQNDSTFLKRTPPDTSKPVMNSDAAYNRPFLQLGKTPIAIGGYMEANTNYWGTDGVSEGFSFQFRRLTIFMSSTITKKIRFLSEIEFEDGTKEINIEFAALDFEFHPLLNLRTGIVMNPIGAFNQNHDGPRWEFVERPISATRMLPATWSNAGFGLHGKIYQQKWIFGYEAYLTNGFDNTIIANAENRTFLPSTKLNRDRFEESFNGSPMFTGKIAIGRRGVGEIGFSYMGGIYNKFQEDGLILDVKRRVDVFAIDFNTTIPKIGTVIIAEVAQVLVQIPASYSQQFGNSQFGGFVDIVQPIVKRKMFGWEKAVINAAVRLEYVDWNLETFNETGGKIYDHIYAITPGISFRPSGTVVMRLNYRYEWQTDILGNPPARTAAVQFGVAAYF
ncbi:MAG TPA: hypothetical protein VK826_14855 [Bacteroidia bacterium]|nr:hypothetical protein [Bacteroidia bacterium]